jgi:type IV secretion system protein VirD4
VLDFMLGPRPGGAVIGGAIEAAADDDGVLLGDEDGVRLAEASAIERADIT